MKQVPIVEHARRETREVDIPNRGYDMASHTVYAVFERSEHAVQAFVELLEHGAAPADVSVITRTSRQHLPRVRTIRESEDRPEGATPKPPHLPAADDMPLFHTPIGDVPLPAGAIPESVHGALEAEMRMALEVTHHLRGKGFENRIADGIQELVLSGGAVVQLHIPSACVDESQAWEIVHRNRGEEVGQLRAGTFLA